jgi:hypothetical protein
MQQCTIGIGILFANYIEMHKLRFVFIDIEVPLMKNISAYWQEILQGFSILVIEVSVV